MRTPSLLFGSFLLVVASLGSPAHAAEVVEYYHQKLDHYFITSDASEKRALDSGVHSGWVRTGQRFQVFNAGDPRLANSVAVCRFYGNPLRGLDSHFYSATPQECNEVKVKFPNEWLLESDAVFRVHAVSPTTGQCPANTIRIHRLYNERADVNHRYTTDPAIVDAMIAKGYTLEGIGSPLPIVFCAANITPPAAAAGTPACSLTVSTEFPTLGQPLNLTATCSGNPTIFGWINCVSSGSTCSTTSSVAGPVMYGIVATNAQGAGAQAAMTLNWQPPAAAPPTCTLNASSSTPPLGSVLLLSASCSDNPVRYDWLACAPLTPEACVPVTECPNTVSSCTPVGKQEGTALYALRATNNAGPSAKVGVTVTWGPTGPGGPPTGGAPSCTLVPSSTTPAINSTLTLTLLCTNAPTAYSWLNCPSSGPTCNTTESTTGPRTYTAFGQNEFGVSPAAMVTVNWEVPPTGPPVCSLSANPASPYVGGTALLTASCTQSPTSYSWTNCTNITGNSCTATNSQTGPVTYTVTGSNVFGPGPPAQLTLTWGTPPPTGADFCGNYTKVKYVDLVWGGQFTTNHPLGGFERDMVLVGKIQVPAGASGTSVPGVASVVEFIDGPAERTLSLSPSTCDFRGFSPGVFPTPDPSGATAPMAWGFGINPSLQFVLSTMSGSPKLIPGQTYYLNIQNRAFSSGAVSCQTPECNVRITVNAPQ